MKKLVSMLLLIGSVGASANTCDLNLFVTTSNFVKQEMPELGTEIKNQVKKDLESSDEQYNVVTKPQERSEFNLAIYYYGDETVYGYGVAGDDRAQYKMDRADWKASGNVDVSYRMYSLNGDKVMDIASDSFTVEGKKRNEIKKGIIELVSRSLPDCRELKKN